MEDTEDEVDEFFRNSYKSTVYRENVEPQTGVRNDSKPKSAKSSKKKTKAGKARKYKQPLQVILDDEYAKQPESMVKTTLKLFSPKEVRRYPRGRPGESPGDQPMRIILTPSPKKRFRRKKAQPPPENHAAKELFKTMEVRETYIEKLKGFVFPAGMNEPPRVFSLEERRIFSALLVAYRTMSNKIVDAHMDSEALCLTATEEEELEQYVSQMGDSMNWLSVDEVIGWVCIDPHENPLLCYYDLAGNWVVTEAAIVKDFNQKAGLIIEGKRKLGYVDVKALRLDPAATTVPMELALSPGDLAKCRERGFVLWRLSYGLVHEMEGKLFSDRNKIDEVKGALIGLAEEMNLSGKAKLGIDHYFKVWRCKAGQSSHMKAMALNRQRQMKRRVMDVIMDWASRCWGFRRLQVQRNHHKMAKVYRAWKAYLEWCRQFNHIVARVSKRRVARCLEAWHHFAQVFHERRNFIINNCMRHLRITFRHLAYNVTLRKYAMVYRLRKGSGMTFAENYMRVDAFVRWKRLSVIAKRLRRLDSVILFGQMRRTARHWIDLTYPPKPPKSLKDRMRELHSVATRHAQTAYNHLSILSDKARKGAVAGSLKARNYIMGTETVRILSGKPKYTEGQLQVFRKQREDARLARIRSAKGTAKQGLKKRQIMAAIGYSEQTSHAQPPFGTGGGERGDDGEERGK
jgi:hypothetical protein